MSHDRYLHKYIQSGKSPNGRYHINIPSGIQTVKRKVERSNTGEFDKESFESYAVNRTKEIDAVCVASRSTHQNVPWNNLDYDKTKYIDTGIFDDERIFLIEAKTNEKGLFKGVGQLKTYSAHFQDYWDAERVEEVLVLLGDDADKYYLDIKDKLPVKFAMYSRPMSQL